jgi:hypothetical protein
MDGIYQDNAPHAVRPVDRSRQGAARSPQPGSWVLGSETHRRFLGALVASYPVGWVVKLLRPRRKLKQNAILHACLTDIAAQLYWPPPPQNDGELHDIEWWKRRCTLQWLIDTKTPYEIITPLYDGGEQEYGLLLPHTSDLDTKQCAELVDWILAFGATNGVTFREPSKGER